MKELDKKKLETHSKLSDKPEDLSVEFIRKEKSKIIYDKFKTVRDKIIE